MLIHLLIVDALNLIRRIHAVQGSPCIHACRFALQQLIEHSQPTHAVAVFDEDDRSTSWRHQILPNYKAGRSPMPENLRQEMPQLQQAFAKLGVASWHSPGNEADDLAATLTAKIASGGHQVTIISTDKGYCQLLAPSVQIRDYFQKRWLDMPFVQQEFGVTPQQLPDYWGLAGISSSKIPGVAGIGPKTAVSLLQQMGSLDELYRQLQQVPEKWRSKLQQHRELAYISKRVATLSTDLTLDGNLQQLRLPIH
ncbi:flap endonuclease Xni [Serratia symbiotica]|uniref:Flap endonuclease Xni n=1 Tax=Serratia symbiotica TaxID=138074 RepID=A0A068Z9B7_9GAMM|nr:flap endonuclease Xni [Serratia symbiotica]MBF1994801.1 flap endonuclease Xni [Serratia symbiotica]MBQ0954436.1 flap endonuclease Xni [Serratia symbiotica]QLH63494.1 flap endonuclease Xni [Serratia symbiotica]QTP13887.1 flap endonuclease Xni [Serratia symbiotica]CDS58805.1 exonuclease IX (5'-3' exonuclease) [Serratia symbiotica]